jgi:hypothetical protein
MMPMSLAVGSVTSAFSLQPRGQGVADHEGVPRRGGVAAEVVHHADIRGVGMHAHAWGQGLGGGQPADVRGDRPRWHCQPEPIAGTKPAATAADVRGPVASDSECGPADSRRTSGWPLAVEPKVSPWALSPKAPGVVVELMEKLQDRSIGLKRKTPWPNWSSLPPTVPRKVRVPDRAVEPVVETAAEVALHGMRVPNVPQPGRITAGRPPFVAIGVLEEEHVARLRHQDTAVHEDQRGREVQSVGEHREFCPLGHRRRCPRRS